MEPPCTIFIGELDKFGHPGTLFFCIHTAGVAGSNPAPPTRTAKALQIIDRRGLLLSGFLLSGLLAEWPGRSSDVSQGDPHA